MADLPDDWGDEPWPLPDPVQTRAETFNPRSWSDTHDPDVLELDADEVWDFAVDMGISYEQAGVVLQRQQVAEHQEAAFQWTPTTTVTVDDITQIYRDCGRITSRIWSEIMSDQPRIIRPSYPDFGF